MVEVLLGSISDCLCMRLETTARYSVDQITAAQLCIIHLLSTRRNFCVLVDALFFPFFLMDLGHISSVRLRPTISWVSVPHNDIPDPEICDRIIQVCCNCSKCMYLKPLEGIFFFSFYFLNKD